MYWSWDESKNRTNEGPIRTSLDADHGSPRKLDVDRSTEWLLLLLWFAATSFSGSLGLVTVAGKRAEQDSINSPRSNARRHLNTLVGVHAMRPCHLGYTRSRFKRQVHDLPLL
jgi:hypothetical protein